MVSQTKAAFEPSSQSPRRGIQTEEESAGAHSRTAGQRWRFAWASTFAASSFRPTTTNSETNGKNDASSPPSSPTRKNASSNKSPKSPKSRRSNNSSAKPAASTPKRVATSHSSEGSSSPAGGRQSKEGWKKVASNTAGVVSGLLPPGLLMFAAEGKADERDARTQEIAQQARERQEAKIGSETKDDSRNHMSERPDLFSDGRVTGAVDAPALAFARNLSYQLINFHMWWSYAVLVMLIYHPVSTTLAILYGIFVATAIFAIYDLVWSFIQGNNLKELSQKYIDLAVKEWHAFKSGERRKAVLIALGIIIDTKNQKKAREEAQRRAKRAKQYQIKIPNPTKK